MGVFNASLFYFYLKTLNTTDYNFSAEAAPKADPLIIILQLTV